MENKIKVPVVGGFILKEDICWISTWKESFFWQEHSGYCYIKIKNDNTKYIFRTQDLNHFISFVNCVLGQHFIKTEIS